MTKHRAPAGTPLKEKFELFFKKGESDDDCWLWNGRVSIKGYGCFNWNKMSHFAHRISHQIYKGEIPRGKIILHSCDNPPCVNPKHLSCGTNKQNQVDSWQKNRRWADCKLRPSDVLAIRASRERQVDLAERYGVSQPAISLVKLGRNGNSILLMSEDTCP